MIFLGLERPVEYGRQLIFDPTMANMVLQAQLNYVNAIKDDYLRGVAELQDFNKEYADLDSPILADNTSYYNLTKGGIKQMFDEASKQGVDLLRSPEGRLMIANYIATRPYDKLANLRRSKESAVEYLKNRAKLEAAGMYNPDLEERYLGYDLAGWDTIQKGMWNRTSPTEFKTLKEATEPWYNNRTPELLNKADVESFGMKFDPRYSYTGFADRHLLDIAAGETPGWNDSVYAGYYRDLARQKVEARGLPYTEADVEKQLQQDVATANREYKALTRTADPFALQAQKAADDRALENLRYKRAIDVANARAGGKSDKEATSYGMMLLGRGIANFSGSADPGAAGLQRAKNFAESTKNLDPLSRTSAFMNFYVMPNAESTASWVNRFKEDPSRTKDAATGGVNYVSQMDNKLLYSSTELLSNTYDYPDSAPHGHSRKNIPSDASMVPTGRVYTAPMADGTYSQFVEVSVGNENGSTNYWYKVAETEPAPLLQTGTNALTSAWNPRRNDTPIAPAGYSVIPSQATANQWSIQDAALNAAAGLAKEDMKAAQGDILDYYLNP